MKKTLIAVAAAAALTTSAFAEITFGSWGKSILVPAANNGDKAVAGQGQSWGGYGRATGLDINGSDADGKAGFSMSYRNTTYGESGTGDNAHLWIKPIDSVTVYAGKVEWNGLRSNAVLPGWDVIRSSIEIGEDAIFTHYAGTGATIVATPNDALTVFAGIPLTNAWSSKKDDIELEDITKTYCENEACENQPKRKKNAKTDEIGNVYARTQAGFGYSIDGIGTVKAQFIGKNLENGNKKNYTGNIQGAFELTAVENLFASVGVDYAIVDKEYVSDAYNGKSIPDEAWTNITLFASYNVSDELTVKANGRVKIATNIDSDADIKPAFQAAGAVDYKVKDGLSFVAQVGFRSEIKAKEKIEDSKVSAMGGFNYSVGSANIFTGFEMETNVKGGSTGLVGMKNPKAGESTQWAIPVVISLAL